MERIWKSMKQEPSLYLSEQIRKWTEGGVQGEEKEPGKKYFEPQFMAAGQIEWYLASVRKLWIYLDR